MASDVRTTYYKYLAGTAKVTVVEPQASERRLASGSLMILPEVR